ncbi:MAG: DUF4835 family protein [Bacteroidota bacterium]
MTKFTATLFCIILLGNIPAFSQELNCDVTINVEQIPSASRDYLRDFEQLVEEYLNTYRWTNEDLGGERIQCTMNIFFLNAGSDNRYTAQVFIGSARPIYHGEDKTERETIILRLLDERWEFEFSPNRPLYHDDFQFDPLADFLDFYAYLIVGFDLETYMDGSGTPYFQKALNICNQAAGTPFAQDWQAQSVNYTRFSMVDELTNMMYQQFRIAFHKYHFDGIDLLSTDPVKGLNAMLAAVQVIADVRQKQNPRSILVKTFFDTKYQEIAESFLRYPDRSVYRRLSDADPNHQITYQEFSLR